MKPFAPEHPEATIRLHKLVRAPRQRVFEALSNAEQVVQWIGPMDGSCEDRHVEIDPRLGGRYAVRMNARGESWAGSGTITAFEPGRKFAYTWTWDNEPGFGGNSVVTFELFDAQNPYEDGPATEVVLTHERLATAHERSEHTGGWWDALRALGYHVRGVDAREAMRAAVAR